MFVIHLVVGGGGGSSKARERSIYSRRSNSKEDCFEIMAVIMTGKIASMSFAAVLARGGSDSG